MTVSFATSWEGLRRALTSVLPHVDRKDSSEALSRVRLDVTAGSDVALVWATNLVTSAVARTPLLSPSDESALLELEPGIVKKILTMFPEVRDSIVAPERVLTITQPRERLIQIEDTSGLFAGQEITVPLPARTSDRFPDVPFLLASHIDRPPASKPSQWLDSSDLGRFAAATRSYDEQIVLTEREGSDDAFVSVGAWFAGTLARFEPENSQQYTTKRAAEWAALLPDPASTPRGIRVHDGRIGDDLDNLISAVRIVTSAGTCSVSVIQRRLRIGFGDAARLVDLLDRFDVIGGTAGNLIRPVHAELVEAPDAVDIICDQILDAARAEDATPRGEAA
ncbi:DNA translocase FtsK [Dietzia cercidiphylli]|uniref:FtsK gamma domain-containing protein n=1 Tax=Dietzia cercidiphylli TaxID=498199 RepID=A0ABP4VCS3_9ACTN|nr:DNA translocase FtsK [Dietzia cercidiphylli]MBB1046438.1 hypothetical protein [Dietzia cercidiphylli]